MQHLHNAEAEWALYSYCSPISFFYAIFHFSNIQAMVLFFLPWMCEMKVKFLIKEGWSWFRK